MGILDPMPLSADAKKLAKDLLSPDTHKTELFQSLIADYDRYAKGGWAFVAGALLRTLSDEMQRTADEIEKAGRVKYEEEEKEEIVGARFELVPIGSPPISYEIHDRKAHQVYKAGCNRTVSYVAIKSLSTAHDSVILVGLNDGLYIEDKGKLEVLIPYEQ